MKSRARLHSISFLTGLALLAIAPWLPSAQAQTLGLPAITSPEELTSPSATPAPPGTEVRRWQTGLLRPDRLRHLSVSYTSGTMVGLTSTEPWAAAGTALTLGLAKELWDARRGRFDVVDLLADVLGAAGAAATTITLQH